MSLPVRVTFDATIIASDAPKSCYTPESVEVARNALEQIVKEACTYRHIRARNIRVELVCVDCQSDCLGADCECSCHAQQGALL